MAGDVDGQVDYWNRIGPTKPFAHPVDLERWKELVPSTASIVDFGCGYGRVLGILSDHGYRNLAGFDPAPAMIALARKRLPEVKLATFASPRLPLRDASADAALLFAVLTCVPTDAAQRAIVAEIARVLRPDGVLYISDLWLQPDERNRARYEQGVAAYGRYGVFELPEGVVLRHHDRDWIRELTAGFAPLALSEITVETMNGHTAQGFQWFGRRRAGA